MKDKHSGLLKSRRRNSTTNTDSVKKGRRTKQQLIFSNAADDSHSRKFREWVGFKSNPQVFSEPIGADIMKEAPSYFGVLEERIKSVQELAVERNLRYEERFRSMDEKILLAFTASEKAVTKAEIATEKRFDAFKEEIAALRELINRLAAR